MIDANIAKGTQSGAKTHHHDQSIYPVALAMKNMIVNIPCSPKPVFVDFLAMNKPTIIQLLIHHTFLLLVLGQDSRYQLA